MNLMSGFSLLGIIIMFITSGHQAQTSTYTLKSGVNYTFLKIIHYCYIKLHLNPFTITLYSCENFYNLYI